MVDRSINDSYREKEREMHGGIHIHFVSQILLTTVLSLYWFFKKMIWMKSLTIIHICTRCTFPTFLKLGFAAYFDESGEERKTKELYESRGKQC